MNSTTPPIIKRRRIWPWVVLVAVLTPVLVLGATAYSFIHLDHDAEMLRRHVMKDNQSDWETRIQLSIGRATLASVRGGLRLVQHEDLDEIKMALAAVRQASVGVYERRPAHSHFPTKVSISDTDRAMDDNGWTRIIGFIGASDTVLIYVPADSETPDRICLTVTNDDELVVVSATIDLAALVDLIEHHAGNDLKLALNSLN
jgi:hypothetical protein